MRDKRYLHAFAAHLMKKHVLTKHTLQEQAQIDWEPEVERTDSYDEAITFDTTLDLEKRMATGSFFTPYDLAEAMVRMTFRDYVVSKSWLQAKEADALFFKGEHDLEQEACKQMMIKLNKLKIIDIACGSGVFLRATYNLYKELYQRAGISFSAKHTIQRLHGRDINGDALDVLKLWFTDEILTTGEKDPVFHIVKGDALLDPYSEQYDLVLGNPPYIGEKNNKALFDRYRHLPGYEGRMDLFYFFIYQGMAILKEDGLLTYITTNYWITADGATKLRRYVKEQAFFHRLINMDECKLFKAAKGMHNLIFSMSKTPVDQTRVQVIQKGPFELEQLFHSKYEVVHHELFSESNNIVIYESKAYYKILQKMVTMSPMRLNAYAQINQGIVSGADRVTKGMLNRKISAENIERDNIQVGAGIFVTEESLSALSKPFYKNSHIKRYALSDKSHQFILYVTDQTKLEEKDPVYQHLLPYKEVLDDRREVRNGVRKWYALQWYRNQQIFEGEKIIAPQRAIMNTFAYTQSPFYASADVYYITGGPLKLLLGVLNARVTHFWLYARGKRKGQYLELYAKPLSLIPVPLMNEEIQNRLETLVEQRLQGDLSIEQEIDKLMYALYGFTTEEVAIIDNLYETRKQDA